MEELGKSLSAVEGIVEAEQAGKPVEQSSCLNCGAPLHGQFCHQCGQKNLPRRQNLGDLIVNFISSFYSFESKFFKTFQYLLFRPGKIVSDYNAGKRESYYHPARMYVFLSFIFFLLISIFNSIEDLGIKDEKLNASDSVKADSIKAVVDSIGVANIRGLGGIKADSIEAAVDSIVVANPTALTYNYSSAFENTTLEEYDSIQNALPEDKRHNFIVRYFERKGRQIEAKGKDKEKETTEQFINDALGNVPRMLFFLMPILALILKLLYIRRDYFYSEHLIFTVFYYDFIYLSGSLVVLVQQITWLSWIQYFLYLWMLIYLYKAMRNVYKQKRAKTVLKFFLLLSMFFLSASVGLVILSLLAFINL